MKMFLELNSNIYQTVNKTLTLTVPMIQTC